MATSEPTLVSNHADQKGSIWVDQLLTFSRPRSTTIKPNNTNSKLLTNLYRPCFRLILHFRRERKPAANIAQHSIIEQCVALMLQGLRRSMTRLILSTDLDAFGIDRPSARNTLYHQKQHVQNQGSTQRHQKENPVPAKPSNPCRHPSK